MTKNLPASVRARLLNIAKDQGVAFQEILVRYGIERLLYRLQQSNHGDEFILKGAMLFLDWTDQLHRPTKDADFLTAGTPEVQRLESVFSDVIQTEVEPDGLEFQHDSVEGGEIREGEVYQGVRIKLEARLGTARIPLQVDVGFGDAVVPSPATVHIPPLLEFPGPELTGYTRYTAVAEKYDAMLNLGELNSRMKDFFDIWTPCRVFEFDGALLCASIHATCERRQTQMPREKPLALTPAFADLRSKRTQWKSFAKKTRGEIPAPELDDLIEFVAKFLWPATQAITDGADFEKTWSPGGPWK